MVYLNADFEGGETEFPEQGRTIVPETGTALFFQHMVLHAGKSVSRGTKPRAAIGRALPARRRTLSPSVVSASFSKL